MPDTTRMRTGFDPESRDAFLLITEEAHPGLKTHKSNSASCPGQVRPAPDARAKISRTSL